MDVLPDIDIPLTAPSSHVPAATVVAHSAWRRVWTAALDALTASRVVAIVGAPGTGKSLMLVELARVLEQAGLRVALLRHTVGVAIDDDVDVLLLDEADRVGFEELDHLCSRARRCVVAGLPAVAERLATLGWGECVLNMAALAEADTAGFVQWHLNRVAAPVRAFDDGALRELNRRTAGIPRDLHILGGLASFAAGLREASTFGRQDVVNAVRLRFGEEDAATAPDHAPDELPAFAQIVQAAVAAETLKYPPARPRRRRRLVWVAVMSLAACVAALAVWNRHLPSWVADPAHAPLATLPAPKLVVEAHAGADARTSNTSIAAALPLQPLSNDASGLVVAGVAGSDAASALAAPVSRRLPETAAIRVVISYATTEQARSRQFADLSARLGRLGYAVQGVVSRGVPGQHGVRFFFAEDAPAARAIAEAIAADPSAIRLSPMSDITPGTIEVDVPSAS